MIYHAILLSMQCIAEEKKQKVAYVGITTKLKNRMKGHFIRRHSSVVTGESAAGLNIEQISEVHWWEHSLFSDKTYLEAAEIIAFEVFRPLLRSGSPKNELAEKKANETEFKTEMVKLFNHEPTGILFLPTIDYLHERIKELDKRLLKLETKSK